MILRERRQWSAGTRAFVLGVFVPGIAALVAGALVWLHFAILSQALNQERDRQEARLTAITEKILGLARDERNAALQPIQTDLKNKEEKVEVLERKVDKAASTAKRALSQPPILVPIVTSTPPTMTLVPSPKPTKRIPQTKGVVP